MFGSAANVIRSILVGQVVLRLAFVEHLSEWVTDVVPSWMQVLWLPNSVTATTLSATLGAAKHPASTIDPHAWPPPAFTALALLTIFTLVVHPDGLTWIMLGKLRYVQNDHPYVDCCILLCRECSGSRVWEKCQLSREPDMSTFVFYIV
jgi:hypothetical protein